MRWTPAIALLAACGGAPQFGLGSGSRFGGSSPWGGANAKYGVVEGILEQPVVGATTDEAQNLWVATHSALYVMKPGERAFRRFDARDGLHLQSNPAQYCDADTAGQIRWTQDLAGWLNRPGNQIYAIAFGDPYKGPCGPAFCNQPVFMVPAEGDVISIQAAAVAADGRVWFASGRTTTYDAPRGLAVWDGKSFRYFDPMRDAGMAESDVRGLVALPDGRLVLAGPNSGLVFWNPQTGARTSLRAGADLPDDHVFRFKLDRMVDPPTLYVATYAGAAALRRMP